MSDKEEIKEKTKRIYEVLPQLDDRRCGYKTCGMFARAVAEGKAPCDGCVSGGPDVAAKVCEIMGVKIPEPAFSQAAQAANTYPPGLNRGRVMGSGSVRGRPGRKRGSGHGGGRGRGFGKRRGGR